MKTIGIYPGNFQPAHRGHVEVYSKLRQVVGPDVFVTTTDRTPTPEAPLNFGEKESIWVRHGVPASHIFKVDNWKQPKEIYMKISQEHTNGIFALTEKEIEELKVVKRPPSGNPPPGHEHKDLHSVEVWTHGDGQAHYFQPYKGNEHEMESLKKHAYVMVVEDNMIDGKPISTANVREGLGSPRYTEEQKKRFFKWAFGWFDIGLFQLLYDKFRSALKTSQGSETQTATPHPATVATGNIPNISAPNIAVTEEVNNIVRDMTTDENLNKFIDEFMNNTNTPQGEDPLDSLLGGDSSPGEAQRQQDTIKARQDVVKAKSAAERELSSLKADAKWKEADLKRKKQDEIPDKRKEIDTLSRQVSSV
jgi:hypothetical protein